MQPNNPVKDPEQLSLEELLKRRRARPNVNLLIKEKLRRMDKFAIWITQQVGSMGFFLLIFGWTVGWLGWNTLAPKEVRFDPFPAFVLWLFLSNVIQICLMPLIMVGQNLLSAHADAREEADFEVNTKAELEIKAIIQNLEKQNKMMLEILQELKKGGTGDAEL